MWLSAGNIDCVHGFSTRHGGISPAPFNSLNLGGSQDDSANIAHNRKAALENLGLAMQDLCFLKQVHGTTVCMAAPGQQEGDALVTAQKGLVLAISIADCYPILFYDAVNQVAGAAHAGWRGTAGGISAHVIEKMKSLGAEPAHIRVAIGQGICQSNFEVGPEVIARFKNAGFPAACYNENTIDLIKCNIFTLQNSGIQAKHTWAMNRCTSEADFFSYRRDKGVTGRMWAVIAMH